MANERNQKKERPGTMIYFELMPVIDELSDADAGKFVKAFLHYAKEKKIPDFSDNKTLKIIWPLVSQRIDRDNERYISIGFENSLKRRYAGYKSKKEGSGQIPLSYEEWKEAISK